jgi:hypothetical protein
MSSLEHPARLRRRGFQNVEEKHLRCPLGPWARGQRQKRLGWMGRKDLYEGIEGISKKLFMMMGEGNSPEEVDTFLDQCREELMDASVRVPPPFTVLPSASSGKEQSDFWDGMRWESIWLTAGVFRYILACRCK